MAASVWAVDLYLGAKACSKSSAALAPRSSRGTRSLPPLLILLLLIVSFGVLAHATKRAANQAAAVKAVPVNQAVTVTTKQPNRTPATNPSLNQNQFGVREFGYTATYSAGQTMGGGSCGYGSGPDSAYGIYTLSASSVLYRNGLNCGACYRLQCSGSALCLPPKTPVLTVTNTCPPGGPGGWCNGARKSYSIAPAVWNAIARDPNYAVVPVSVERVPCPRVGGITFQVVQGNAFYFSAWWAVVISNVGGSGDILSVWVKRPGSYWEQMTHSFGAVWGISRLDSTSGNPGAYFSFKITTGFQRQSLLVPNAIPATYQTNFPYSTNVNFKLGPAVPSTVGRNALETEVFNATLIVPRN